ncbi:3-oxoadipyl-CoA thiolase [Nocardia neocaledoniensis NBRC 108232]|uniref:3-oxoadipyl-CoA thiolase n=1 Tax=Nocardia neocaledoniensis TaxID=236511 RepID=A0A317N3C8_9NOCA|nr:3-oxoadipyl-CoA thiolase [Nocardia neocaledoniensis]PWV68777.1 3-oxoadipyl-CoA thiolase [Nocardia neocaledoniensis]GEM31517.1 3-oxoadipyl-CoA thiolase [Nocardia neocaledoniensis NBRC 108232]
MSGRAYLVDGVRTPFGRYGGALAAVRPDDLAAHVLTALTQRLPTVDFAAVDDVVFGCANQAGEDNRNVARMAALLAGLPVTVPGVTVNRLCASGLDAVAYAARAITAGDAELVIAGGVESMTRAPFVVPKAAAAWDRSAELADTTLGWRLVNPRLRDRYGVDSMPETAQHVAAEHGIARADQDAFALRSQQRAAAAIAAGRLAREIAPVPVPRRRGEPVVVETDEHPRATDLEALAGLRPVVPDGSITAGNSSGINDGAVAILLASETAVRRYGLTPLAAVGAVSAAGVPPRTMGIGPVPAVGKLLARTGLGIGDIDVVELNEAFAAQALAVLRGLGLPDDAAHVNPNGGAIAIGHPLGATGARLALTAAIELADRDARHAIATLCVGVGQGLALHLHR